MSLFRMKQKNKGYFWHNIIVINIFLACIVAGIIFLVIATIKVPDFDAFAERRIANSTKIYDRTGEIVLFDIHNEIRRTVIPLTEMGQNIQDASIAIEDKEFYNHNGIRVTSIIRAVFANLKSGEFSQGGSTITQQIVKNTLLTTDKRISRKIKEWVIAVKMEKSLSKEQILEIYLNEAPYGGTIYGIQEASQSFFAKNPKDLTHAESAYLAALPQAPSYFSPYGKNKDKLDERKNLVLKQMKDLGYITEEEFQTAMNEVVEFQPESRSSIKAPHFVFYVKEYLEQKYGTEAVEQGGLRIITTLDYSLQMEAERIVREHALENEELYNASNAALVAINPLTGEIITMVGSRDYFDEKIDGKYNIATAKRQPGSAFKPFIYATAFKEGYTPETVLFDVPTEFQTTCNPEGIALPGKSQSDCYKPENYDGLYKGPIQLRNALGESRNVPAVKLLYLVGIRDAIQTAKNMGVTTLTNPDQYGLTLVLGGGEVKLLDMVSSFGVFATEGIRHEPIAILEVQDEEGNVLEKYEESEGSLVFDPEAIKKLNSVLSDNNARVPLLGANNFMYFGGRDVAGKTGTTNNNRDAWMMGYTPNLVVGVWSGNNDNTPMKKGSAISGRLWRDFMDVALQTTQEASFSEPAPDNLAGAPLVLRGIWQGNESVEVDTITGDLATEFTPLETRKEYVITNVHSILYWLQKNNPRQVQIGGSGDAQFNNWEYAVQKWWNSNKQNYQIITKSSLPDEYDSLHTEEDRPVVSFEKDYSIGYYKNNEEITIEIDIEAEHPVEKADYYLNNVFIGSNNSNPYSLTFLPSSISSGVGKNILSVTVTDKVLNKTTIQTEITISE